MRARTHEQQSSGGERFDNGSVQVQRKCVGVSSIHFVARRHSSKWRTKLLTLENHIGCVLVQTNVFARGRNRIRLPVQREISRFSKHIHTHARSHLIFIVQGAASGATGVIVSHFRFRAAAAGCALRRAFRGRLAPAGVVRLGAARALPGAATR